MYSNQLSRLDGANCVKVFLILAKKFSLMILKIFCQKFSASKLETRLGFVLFAVSHLDGHHFSIETLWLCSPGDVDGESLCESIRINNDDNVSPGLVFDRNAILY